MKEAGTTSQPQDTSRKSTTSAHKQRILHDGQGPFDTREQARSPAETYLLA
jgi:hypothetical protein